MAGIYVHIPFCRRACHYCDFHFTTNLKNATSLVDAIVQEIELRKSYLEEETIRTIYFGGGTPSLLSTSEIERVLNSISKTHRVDNAVELTLEANPEDLTLEKLKELRSVGVNRLSLGTQSFIDTELKWMNRMHSSKQAIQSIEDAQTIGFNNISIDLIFGLPDQSETDWQINLDKAVELDIQHISSYSLTVEPKTVLSNRIEKGKQQPPDENDSAKFFEMNMEYFPSHGFEHYEISNFAKDGFVSKHNSSYWLGEKYLGLGPSAHSYNGIERSWNIRSNGGYIQRLNDRLGFQDSELLSASDRINEHIMTGLRTKWGVQKSVIEDIETGGWNRISSNLSFLNREDLEETEESLQLTASGKLKADKIASTLFVA